MSDTKEYSKLIRDAFRIRLVEERIIDLYPSDLIQSPVHLSIGQEAVAVGVCANLRPEDWVFINYRGHAFYLAKGGPLPEFFAELMGRRTGLSKGKAGSMHLAAPEVGVIGASAVVASTISHAVGAALASKILRQNDRIFIANFGDGATEQGVFHESLNFASLHRLPVLFLCEDNGLAVHAHKSERQSYNLRKLVESYGIAFYQIHDGYDPDLIFREAGEVVRVVRESLAPAFLQIATLRYREHVGPGDDFEYGYRSRESIQYWLKKDPLERFRTDLERYESEINDEIDQAVEFAMNSPFPTSEDLLTDV
jgi:TPP-dependent pyruvate/acetoin dehydrogenase alpha subunit